MYQFLLAIFNENEINEHILEVILENEKARTIYEKIGYQINRMLFSYKGRFEVSSINKQLIIKELLDFKNEEFDNFWNHSPSWQNSILSIQNTNGLHKILGGFLGEELVAYLIYSPTTLRVKQFAVKKNYRRQGIGQSLFSELNTQIDTQEIALINLDSRDSETVRFLENGNLTKFISQYEMIFHSKKI